VNFSDPIWLGVGLACCLGMIAVWFWHDARQRAALARFVGLQWSGTLTQSRSPLLRRLQRFLLLLAVLLLVVALAGPQWGYRWDVRSSRGNEIAFALDTSRSMLTPDVKPNRLTRAKLGIDDFVNHLDGDAVGIVAFAGSAFLVSPITLDYRAVQESLAAIDTETIPRGGTNIASAIAAADQALHRRAGGERILIIVSDGEDLEGDAVAAAQAAARDGLRIFTVGVGTAAGEPIPLPLSLGGGFVKDETDAFVRSRLDEPGLKAIAAAGGGFYAPLGVQAEGLEAIFTQAIAPLAKHDLSFRQQKIYIERFQWPLAASLALLLASLMVGTRRRRPARKLATLAAATLASGACVLCLPGLPMHAAMADAPTTTAATTPAPATKAAPAAELQSGAAAYRAGQFPLAERAFRQSIEQAPSDASRRLAEQEDAYYNLGNTLYRAGQKTEQTSREETLKSWNAAVAAYETALQLRADDADSKFNRDFVKRKIAALQEPPDPNKSAKNGGGGGGGPNGQPPKPPGGSPPAAPKLAGPPPAAQPAGAAGTGAGATPPMSADEARELLDSAKGDERHAAGFPPPAGQPPDKPYKNW
jgi:Ca-activated chloride channel family protein